MAIVFITGSTDGLGRAAAQSLLDQGHRVVLHARSADRAAALGELASRAAGVVVGDLQRRRDEGHRGSGQRDRPHGCDHPQCRRLHGAEPRLDPGRPCRHSAINTLAPYMLTALIERPAGWCISAAACIAAARVAARPRLDEPALGCGKGLCREQAARRRAGVCAGASLAAGPVQRGRSRLGAHEDGRRGCPGGIETGQRTQTWLAVSDEPAAKVSGRYWHHLRQQQPAAEATDRNSRTS